jgi:hypothetical protein
MIRHTVLFKLKSDVSKLEVERIFTDILGLTNRLVGILAITGGTCYFHDQDEGESQIFSHGFSIDFQDKKSRDAFVNNPITHPVKNNILKIADGGQAGIYGFDFGA